MSKLSVFVLGATGYIGGAALVRIFDLSLVANFQFHALVRSAEKAEKLKTVGINPVIGSLNDTDLIQQWASSSDIVISIADCDHLPSVKAILAGLKERHDTSGKVPILIHTSGTGVLADNAAGMYSYDTIWNDADPEQMATLPPTQVHRNVDLPILDADTAGYIKSYIIIPSTVYGIAQGRFVDIGIQNPHSIQIPTLIRSCLDRKQGGMVGEGKNIWPNVHVEELGDLFALVFNAALTKSGTGHGLDGYYFGASDEHTLYDIGRSISEAFVDMGLGKSPEPTTFTKDEIDKYFAGSTYLGSNSRCRADHSFSLGWNPKKTTKDLLASIRPEVEAVVKLGNSAKADSSWLKATLDVCST
ncbi:hypothetical protein ONZ45_g18699 [Pleurotus djamor]|nr:hypothetical protein ONZ45_g18699 [Pleurotus djamor]